jgi:hypothetical protein
MNISEKEYAEIEELIGSEESVVGIDAKKTHIIIIQLLRGLTKKVDSLENRISELEGRS